LVLIELKELKKLISLFGLFVFLLICLILSENPSKVMQLFVKYLTFLYNHGYFFQKNKVKIKTIIGGLFLQLSLGLFVMKTDFGYYFFKFISDEMQKFLFFTDHGTKLVFGQNIEDHYITFKVI
jgi:nucleoside permease NupC